MIDFTPRIGQEASRKTVVFGINQGFNSNGKALLSNIAIVTSDGLEKVSRSINLFKCSVYRSDVEKQARILSAIH